MVLSDRTIRAEIEAGRIVVDPYDESLIQPSSIDVRVDNRFRVFQNSRYPYIDVRQPMEDLTELVEIAGEDPFILHPGEFVLGQTLERVTLPDDVVSRLEGKALSLDTRIPTPIGWRTMAELNAGDYVFDPEGYPLRVTATSEIMLGRDCSQVVFSDGARVVADDEHLWEAQSPEDRRRRCVRLISTAEIKQSLMRNDREYRWRVPQARAVHYPEQNLPVDPYVLGAWIGDGTSTTAEITCADPEILEAIEYAGVSVRKTRTAPYKYRLGSRIGQPLRLHDPDSGQFLPDDSLQSDLRRLGVLGNKHIPRRYMQASVPQRRALLEGLMDTDGYIDTQGRCDLTTVKRHLAGQYCELIASLGHRPVIAEKPAKLYGKDCGTRYEVTFTPSRTVFRLRRKRYRQEVGRKRRTARSIVEVRRVPSVPVKCIEVEGQRGAYLATTSFITTHNSSLGRLGLLIHSTAGFVDPGWDGNLTLELSNVANLPITIYHGMPIGQMSFMRMDGPVEHPYGSGEVGSKYRGQGEPTPSRFYKNFE